MGRPLLLIIILSAAGFALGMMILAPRCQPGDPSITLGHLLMSGCK